MCIPWRDKWSNPKTLKQRLLLVVFTMLLLLSCASTEMAKASKNQAEFDSVEIKETKNGFATHDSVPSTETESHPVPTGGSSKDPTISPTILPTKDKNINSNPDRTKSVPTNSDSLQWYEFAVRTHQPLGAYELELSFDSEVAIFQKLAGGKSIHFSALPWCDTKEVQNGKLRLSSFHGSLEGPTGEVSLGRILFRARPSFSLSGRFLTLVSPDQKRISGEFICRIEPSPFQDPVSFSKPSTDSSASTEVFVLTHFPLGGYVLVLEYDPKRLHIQEIRGGTSPYFTSTPFSSPQTYQSGKTKISAFYGGFPGPIGKISICWIFFKTLQKGRSPLRIEQLELSDSEGQLKEGSSELSPAEIEQK